MAFAFVPGTSGTPQPRRKRAEYRSGFATSAMPISLPGYLRKPTTPRLVRQLQHSSFLVVI
jgi:hypothetical protein